MQVTSVLAYTRADVESSGLFGPVRRSRVTFLSTSINTRSNVFLVNNRIVCCVTAYDSSVVWHCFGTSLFFHLLRPLFGTAFCRNLIAL